MDRQPGKWVIAATVMVGNIMAVLDSSIVNVALPDMAGNLGATIEEITWVVTGYILANVLIMPIVGMLSARYGRKRLYMLAIAVFTVASMMCGMAHSLSTLVLYRAVQGLAGGVLITVPQAVLRESFPPYEQGLAMGVYGMGVVLAPAIGPTLGGWLTDRYSWPWVFFINVPIGLLNIFMVQRVLSDPPYLERRRDPIDYPGLGFMIVGLGAFQLMLEEGQQDDWFSSTFIVRLAVLAGVGMLLFVWRELVADRPAVDLRILRNLPFAAATVLGGIMGAGLSGTLFVLPLFLENLLGFPAMDAGLALMPRSVTMLVAMPVAGRLYNRMGARLMVAVGLALLIVGYVQLATLTTQTGIWDLVLPQAWTGVGFSFLFAALSTAALSRIAKAQMTAATGLYNVVRQVMGSIGIAVAATTLTRDQQRYHALLAEDTSSALTRDWMARTTAGMQHLGASLDVARQRALGLLELRVSAQAAVLSYNRIFMLVAVLFVVTAPLILLLPRTAHRGEAVEIAAE
ncbi:MAG: DHA2 family efflux MFS transporter permease subunit [Gemmatimonadota bacterium]|nr:DHA2 family efflux MFS transporter permease subunit [Gemmatimonadota bacterium]MDE3217071.1 DHA2 family efflux MFS transporter permease subunit [Gemmatimonadota bacterium]